MPQWPHVLLELAVTFVKENNPQARAPSTNWKTMLEHLAAGFNARPYGDPSMIVPAATSLANWADALAGEINSTPCEEPQARQLLKQFGAVYQNQIVDYDSARLIAWGLRDILREVGDDPQVDLPEGPRVQLPLAGKQEDYRIGMTLEAELEPIREEGEQEVVIVRFRPVGTK